MSARVAWIFGACVAMGPASCHCRQPAPSESWNFEDDCVDDTCGFRATQGTVTRAATLATGEHGLELGPDSIAVREQVSPWRGPYVQFVGMCDVPGVVELSVTVDGDAGTEQYATRFSLTPSWTESQHLLSVPTPAPSYVTRVELHNTTTARCLIDVITIGVQENACPI